MNNDFTPEDDEVYEFNDEDFNVKDSIFIEDEFNPQFTDADFPFDSSYSYVVPPKVDPIFHHESSKKSRLNNIEFEETESGNYRIKSQGDIFSESLYFEPVQMYDGETYNKFIEKCKDCIRTSLKYSAYIAYLKNDIGLRYDAFNSEITDEVATIEMHHGPILTLHDYVKLMMDWAFDTGKPVTTFSIAKKVMEEHAENRVQVVMLSKTNHALVHGGKLKVDMRQCHGNLYEFIQRYQKYIMLSPSIMRKFAQYKADIDNNRCQDTSVITPSKVISWNTAYFKNRDAVLTLGGQS